MHWGRVREEFALRERFRGVLSASLEVLKVCVVQRTAEQSSSKVGEYFSKNFLEGSSQKRFTEKVILSSRQASEINYPLIKIVEGGDTHLLVYCRSL